MLQEEKAVITLAGSAPQKMTVLSAQQWLTEPSGKDADRSSVLIVQRDFVFL
jgi:hypothetical protein